MWKVQKPVETILDSKLKDQIQTILDLVGHTVIKTESFLQPYGEYIVLTFDNGINLTAQDGEYDCNTLRILDEREYRTILQHNLRIRLLQSNTDKEGK